MADRRRQGLCYNCDEQYARGHKCQRLFYLEVSDFVDDDEPPQDAIPAAPEEPLISLHAIAGIRTADTMRVRVSVGNYVMTALLDTGSTHKWGSSPEDQQRRRTIYVFQRRSLALPIVEVFDGADMSNTCPRRAVTTIAPQALALFNGEFSRTASQQFAERVVKEAGNAPEKRIERAYRIAFVRRPTPAQKSLALSFLQKQAQLYARTGRKDADLAALADLCHVLINTNEFLYLD